MKHEVKGIISFVLLLFLSLLVLTPVYAANMTEAETKAAALKQLSLIRGVSENSFGLDRAPTRTEALVMLIRVLGKEAETANGNWVHPFTDVPSYADKCIGYAYEQGLTGGISATEFGTGIANSDMYLTFVLRALGYTVDDFVWDAPDALAQTVGILPSGVDTSNFLRADVVLVSWAALEAKLKDGSQTLAEKLMGAGVFTAEEYIAAKQSVGETTYIPPTVTYELKDGVALVKSMVELKGAMADAAVTEIEFAEAFSITEDITITKPLLIVEKDVANNATLTVKAEVTLGGVILENMDSIIVSEGGFFGVYQTVFNNREQFLVEKAGMLELDRGGEFKNFGTLTNTGTIGITDNGGNMFNDKKGLIINNGVIDCSGYYNNEGTYTGTGTEPIGI